MQQFTADDLSFANAATEYIELNMHVTGSKSQSDARHFKSTVER